MPTVILSSTSRIALPVQIVQALNLKPGDKLVINLEIGRIVLWPKPHNYTDYFGGCLEGTWGSKQEVDNYLAKERASLERPKED